MKTGTKSLLFGVHNVIWHPITVYIAWVKLYKKLPSPKEAVCIFIHDWGYWGCDSMDSEQGQKHPALAGAILKKLGWSSKYVNMCIYHSRSYASMCDAEPSKLCWADKLSMCYDPVSFYLFRAKLSGELKEYREECVASGLCTLQQSNREWYGIIRQFLVNQYMQQIKHEEVC